LAGRTKAEPDAATGTQSSGVGLAEFGPSVKKLRTQCGVGAAPDWPSTPALRDACALTCPPLESSMFRLLRALGYWLLLSLVITPAGAADVQLEGFDFSGQTQIYGQTLTLNGVATSSILSTRSSVVGLYLPSKQTTPEGAFAVKGAKRIQFYMLRTVSARDLANAFLDRIRQNVSTEEFGANIISISQVGAVFNTLKNVSKGDKITIDYQPATQTTEFIHNGQRLGDPVKGEAFFPLMMKIWMGPKIRASTREGLLGQ
jgi:Chalcone isomerase-like